MYLEGVWLEKAGCLGIFFLVFVYFLLEENRFLSSFAFFIFYVFIFFICSLPPFFPLLPP